MLYLLKNHSERYRLYCSNRELLSTNSCIKQAVFKAAFQKCNDFVIVKNRGSWGTRESWYEIVDEFDSDDYPELFI